MGRNVCSSSLHFVWGLIFFSTYRALTDEEGIVVSVCGGRTPEPSRPMLVNNIHDKEDEQRGIFVPVSGGFSFGGGYRNRLDVNKSTT
jgi:hypothetical protein